MRKRSRLSLVAAAVAGGVFLLSANLTVSRALPWTKAARTGGSSSPASHPVAMAPAPPALITVSVSPSVFGLTVSQQVHLTASVQNDSSSSGVTWSVSGANCSGSACGTLSAPTSSSVNYTAPTAGGVYLVTATSVADVTRSASASIGVTDLAGVFTYRNDNLRSSINSKEYLLTPSNVNTTSFGKLFTCSVDGSVYAQPLWIPNVAIGGGTHNVVIVATQHDSVYAFDADNGNGTSCTQYWKASLLTSAYGAGAGATPVPAADTGELQDILTEVGITSTPVIDPLTKSLYVVAKTKESGSYVQRLHRLTLADGTEAANARVNLGASVAGVGDGSSNNSLPYIPLRQNQRPGLALVNGTIYMASGSHGDNAPWHGWILAYNATTLAFTGAFCTTPNTHGGGIWMSGSAPVVDSSNNMYVIASNGAYDGISEFGDSFLKLNLSGGVTISDWFTPDDQASLNANNGDLGAGGAVTLLDSVAGPFPHLLIGGGKEGILYLVNRDAMGHFHSGDNSQAVQTWSVSPSGISSSGEFWQNTFYIAAVNAHLEAFAFNTTSGLFNTSPTSQSAATFGFPGLTPAISASGTSNAILWAVDSSGNGTNGAPTGPAVLYAYDPSNLENELWDSAKAASSRDQAGNAVKFVVPTIANGKVYMGAKNVLNVYGVLDLAPAAAAPTFGPAPGTYTSAQNVSLLDTTSGATIYYTLDGSTPTTASTVYSNPLNISGSTTINAMASAVGLNNSTVSTGTYTIQGSGTGSIGFVQSNYATPQSSSATVNVSFPGAQSAGNLNVVVVGWNDATNSVTSVTDTKGNVYSVAVGPTLNVAGALGQSIYYAKNIAAAPVGANTVTVTFSGAASFPDIRILEYSGADSATPLDISGSATGNSTTSSVSATTTKPNDLILGANIVRTGTTGPGAGFTSRMITAPDGDIVEDRLATAPGSYTASAPLSPADQWIMQIVAFRVASASDTTPPTAPSALTATAVSASQINLGWAASTDNVGVTGYLVERCQAAGCTAFAQIATPSATSYSDTGLFDSTAYSYRVRATDAAGNLSGYSNVTSATTLVDTTPPTAPSNLAATPVSSVQIDLGWTASTDNVGVTGYLVERCQGSGCTNFVQVAAPRVNSVNDTGLTASTIYSYRVRAMDNAGNLSPYSNTAVATTLGGPDTTPPTAPTNLTATAASSVQINLSWTASTDNVGVTGYKVERCAGAACSNFAQIAAPAGTTFSDTGLTAATSYSYRVRATDAANNLSTYSNTASATTLTGPPPTISFVQVNSATPQSASTTVPVTYAGAQTAGDLNVVAVGWNDATQLVNSVTDSKGNVYTLAVGPTMNAAGLSQSIYYAKNIAAAAAGTNTVTVTFNGAAAFPDIRILEYSGADLTAPLDVTAVGTGNSATSSTVAVTTTNANDLLFAANMTFTGATGPGAGFTSRIITVPDHDLAEDRLVAATGSYTATSPISPASQWLIQMVALKVAGGIPPPPDTTPPTAPTNLTATAASSVQINLSWTASTDNVGVTGYKVERCAGAACSNFAQIAAPAGTTFSDTGLTAATSYSYRVRATDAANNLSTYSNTASATTLTGPPPTISFVQVNSATPQSSSTTVNVPFLGAQAAGDLNVVVVGWNDATRLVSSVTDSKGNTYTAALGPKVNSAGGLSQSIYYAKNIAAAAAGTNTVTVTFNGAAAFPDIRILEYSGADLTAPLDVTAAGTGNSATSATVAVTTTNANDLLFAANIVATGTTGPGAGFTSRTITIPDGDIAEDRLVTVTGSYSVTAPVSPTGQWIMQMVAFKVATLP